MFFDTVLKDLDVDITFASIVGVDNSLMPNTGELLKISSIKIKGNYGDNPENLKEDDRNITILPPLDPYNDEVGDTTMDLDESNIFRNKGAGYKFYASDGTNNILLATFELKDNPEHIEGVSPYNVVYNTDIFDNEYGKVKEAYSLTVDNDKLVFKNGSNNYTEFSIIPIKDGIRPGDDLRLRFGLQNNYLLVTGSAKDKEINRYSGEQTFI